MTNLLFQSRKSTVSRKTKETEIEMTLNLDGSGEYEIHTGIGFFDHMLTQIAVHGLFDLYIKAKGDLAIDTHHTVEDIGIVLGQAVNEALADRIGIYRMSYFYVPMDDACALVVIDFSGRAYTIINTPWNQQMIGDLPVSLIEHFFESFSVNAMCNLHINMLYGKDDHHKCEAIFKAFARALREAVMHDPRRGNKIPSTKGTL